MRRMNLLSTGSSVYRQLELIDSFVQTSDCIYLWLGCKGKLGSMKRGHWGAQLLIKDRKCQSLTRVWLSDPMDYRPPGSSVLGILPGKTTGVGCHSLSRGSSQSRDWTRVFCTVGRFFTIWTTREAYKAALKPEDLVCSITLQKKHAVKRPTEYLSTKECRWL